jgi:hypothetical protein
MKIERVKFGWRVDGWRHGPWREVSQNGAVLMEGRYRSGCTHGRFYYENGRIYNYTRNWEHGNQKNVSIVNGISLMTKNMQMLTGIMYSAI